MSVDLTIEPRMPAGGDGRLFGVHPAIVTDNVDPEAFGRIKVRFPWLPNGGEAWARLATMMAGHNRGSWFIPDIDDEVLVAFEAGDARHPCVIGALWNGRDRPPQRMDHHGRNDVKTLRSRSGVAVTFNDGAKRESLTLETPGGQRLLLEDRGGAVTIEDGHGNSVALDRGGVTVRSEKTVTVQAGAVHLAAGKITVDAGVTRFSGVIQADTLIANTVVKKP